MPSTSWICNVGFAPKVVELGLARILEEETESSRTRIADIIISLLKDENLNADDVWPVFQKQTSQLTDVTYALLPFPSGQDNVKSASECRLERLPMNEDKQLP